MTASERPGRPGQQFPDAIPWLVTQTPGPVPALDTSVTAASNSERGERPKRRLPVVATERAPSAVATASAPAAAATAPVPVIVKSPAKPKKKRPGSGIPARKIITNLVWLRRAS